MSTVNDLIDEIKSGCPELSDSIEIMRKNIHHKTRSKAIKTKKKPIKPPVKPPVKTPKKEPVKKPKKEQSNPPTPDPPDEGKPFSSIQGCGVVNFNDSNIDKIKKTSFLKKSTSKGFTEISTDPDGNCGYHGLLQGMFETYYLLGNESSNYLKQFIKEIKEKFKVDPKEIAANNRKKNYISIPREIVNHFRRHLLELIDPKRKMPDGSTIHYFEREDEVPDVLYDTTKEKYTKKKKIY